MRDVKPKDLYDENGIPWRLSADPGSKYNLPESVGVKVLVDGKPVDNVVYADRVDGYIDRHPRDQADASGTLHVPSSPGEHLVERIYGKVEFRFD